LLPGGALRGLQDVSGWRGVHVLRTAGSTGATDLPAASVATLEDEVQPAKLNLRRSRPLVSLSYLRDGAPTLTALERSAAPTFVQAGCSALVGALWSVQRTAESAFLRRFYYDLWAGNSLGTAFERGRRLARAAAPGSLDWLAYVCYGDPMARPYRLVQGDGYTVIEAVGRKMEDRLRPGERIRFRASLRRKPPAWHEGRLVEVAEELAFDDLRLHVIATGLDVEPSSPITMQRWPSGDFLGRFTLAVPAGTADGTAVVQVYFVDGQKPVQNMTFSLVIEN
jgi:hypothetical protein